MNALDKEREENAKQDERALRAPVAFALLFINLIAQMDMN
jgi:hypothetical protein